LVRALFSLSPSSLTWPTFIMYVDHVVCDLSFCWREVVSDYDLLFMSVLLSLFKMLLSLLLTLLSLRLLLTLLLLSFFILLLTLLVLVLLWLRHFAYVFSFESLA
jgi:hypothetical protein